MTDLTMNEATFRKVVGRYLNKPIFIGMDGGDLEVIFNLVEDLLEAERDAVQSSEPYALKTIDRLETARHEVFMLGLNIGDAWEEAGL